MFGYVLGDVQAGKIHIFYGKMGSGKSTNALHQVLDFHDRGKPVWVNFPIAKLPPWKGKPEAEPPVYYEDDPAGILSMRDGLFVIDEAYLSLNAREWQNLPKAVFTAFTHVRKLHMTVIVIAQSWMRIDKSIREVASTARLFEGGTWLGRIYEFKDYEVDELGDIVKKQEIEYETATKGFTFIRSRVYEAFDSDHMFGNNPVEKIWKSAIGYGTIVPVLSPPTPQAAVFPPSVSSTFQELRSPGGPVLPRAVSAHSLGGPRSGTGLDGRFPVIHPGGA